MRPIPSIETRSDIVSAERVARDADARGSIVYVFGDGLDYRCTTFGGTQAERVMMKRMADKMLDAIGGPS